MYNLSHVDKSDAFGIKEVEELEYKVDLKRIVRL